MIAVRRALAATGFALAICTPALAQQSTSPASVPSPQPAVSPAASSAPPPPPVSSHNRRKAAHLFMQASKAFTESRFEQAVADYAQSAQLDPADPDYARAAEVARSHASTALVEASAQAKNKGDQAAAAEFLRRAHAIDPTSPQVAEHLDEMAADAVGSGQPPLYATTQLGDAPVVSHTTVLKSFHAHAFQRQVIQDVFRSYGVEAILDQSVPSRPVQFDVDSVPFERATQLLSAATQTFFVPLDERRVVVAHDDAQNRRMYERADLQTYYLPGMNDQKQTEVGNVIKNLFPIESVAQDMTAGTITVRAGRSTLHAIDATLSSIRDNQGEVMLDVRVLQLAHTADLSTGAQLPQQFTAFNVYSEEQSILNANQALVQQIISSGLAAPGDTLAILAILIAAGAVPSSLFSNGIALFGGGLTLSGVTAAPVSVAFNLNSSDTRALDRIQLRLTDGQKESITSGTRYPILQSSFSGLGTSGINIPGLTAAGTSGGLSSLISALGSATTQVPQVQYQDLGLTLVATPSVMRNGDVALVLDLKITALAGSSANGIPVLNNRSYSGVITLKSDVGAVLMSELDEQETHAVNGTPGLSEIPGLNNITDKTVQHDTSTLLIVLTPHLAEAPLYAGHTPMLPIEHASPSPNSAPAAIVPMRPDRPGR